MPAPDEITEILAAARGGDRAALDQVFSRVYAEIRRIAHGQIARAGGSPTLDTTAVVHEAYLKLVRSPAVAWEDRGHFYAVAATAMRQILLNHARARRAKKRGGGGERPAAGDVAIGFPGTGAGWSPGDAPRDPTFLDFLELDAALTRLQAVDDRMARVVDLRFFAGLSVEETAEVLGVTDRTVKRDWRAARAFLYRELGGEAA